MCGIWACLGFIDKCEKHVSRLEARGPEGTRIVKVAPNVTLGFTRLAINGLTDAGMQPYFKWSHYMDLQWRDIQFKGSGKGVRPR